MLLKGLWGLYSCMKFNYFPPEYVWDEYPSTISILPYTWNNDVFRDKKNFWCIKITNQIILLLKGYTNLVKEQSLLHSRLRIWPFMNILPHQLRICEYFSIRNPYLICKNIAPMYSDHLVSTQHKSWLFCCPGWGCGCSCCWAVSI